MAFAGAIDPLSVKGTVSGTTLAYEFRVDDGGPVSTINAKLNGKNLPVQFTSFRSSRRKTAYAMLIDASGLKDSKSVVRDFGYSLGTDETFGIFVAEEQIRELAPFGIPRIDWDARLQNWKPKTPLTPKLYRSAFDAIEILKGIQADRRALIIVSSGLTSDNDDGISRIADAARTHGVVVSTFAIGKPSANLSRLSAQTFGIVESGSPPLKESLTKNFASRVRDAMMEGGTATLDISDAETGQEILFEIVTTNNQQINATWVVPANVFKATPTPTPSPTASPTPSPTPTPTPREERKDDPRTSIWMSPWLYIGVGLLFLLSTGLYFITQRNRVRPEPPLPPVPGPVDYGGGVGGFPPPPVPDPQQYARARLIIRKDGATTREFLMFEKPVTIGRSRENSLVLYNTSVHKHHASIHQNAEGKFILSDLGGENGVKLNGRKISSPEFLTDGMSFELGEVVIEFIILSPAFY